MKEPPTLGAVLTQKLTECGVRPSDFHRKTGVKLGALLSGYTSEIDDDTDRLLAEHLGTEPKFWRGIAHTRWEWDRSRKKPKPNPALVQLRSVLVDVAGDDDVRVENALRRIVEAVDYYRSTAYPVRRRGCDSPVTTIVSDMRKNARKFLDVICSIEGRSDRDQKRILTWYGRLGLAKPIFLHHLGRPGGRLLDDLPSVRRAAQATLAEVMGLPDRSANIPLSILSAVVARTLNEDLGVTPTSSRHTHYNISGARGGAAYSWVLERVMVLAGEGSTDLEKWISAGLALANDPDIPL